MLSGYHHCTFCGSTDIIRKDEHIYTCNTCHKTNYINYSAAAGCYLYTPDKKILLAQRARDPQKGKYDDPWWFMDLNDHTVEDTVIRELQEELGITLSPNALHYLGSNTLLYHYQNRDVPVVAINFYAPISYEQAKTIIVNDDVASIKRVSKETFNPDDMCTPRQAELVYRVFELIGG